MNENGTRLLLLNGLVQHGKGTRFQIRVVFGVGVGDGACFRRSVRMVATHALILCVWFYNIE